MLEDIRIPRHEPGDLPRRVRAEMYDAHLDQLTAVVPTRDAEHVLPACLEALRRCGVERVIVVDGLSADHSRAVARVWGATLLSDGGRGPAYARALGVGEARTRWVALLDPDTVIPAGSLEQLLREFVAGGYSRLQLGLDGVAGPVSWGEALNRPPRPGVSSWRSGVLATIFQRDPMLMGVTPRPGGHRGQAGGGAPRLQVAAAPLASGAAT